MLWSLKDNNSSKTHYLFGTMHLSSDDAYAHIDLALEHMKLCSHYIGEMDLTDNTIDTSAFNIPDGQNLSAYLSDKKIAKYAKILQKAFEVNLYDYYYIKPLFMFSAIAEKLTGKNGMALDHFLTQRALEYNKSMGGLETVKEQQDIASNLKMDYQIKSLKTTCKSPNKLRKQTAQMGKYYRESNLKLLNRSSIKQLGSLRKSLLYDRNQTMASKIIELISAKENSYFFAFGAAHLVGNKGVLSALKRQGYKIKKV